MDDIIKSAREISSRKSGKACEATEEERLAWKYVPLGKNWQLNNLRDDSNMLVELSQYKEGCEKYVSRGAAEVLNQDLSLYRRMMWLRKKIDQNNGRLEAAEE